MKRELILLATADPAGVNKMRKMFREGQLDFELKADGTFTCVEVMDAVKANYRGNWELKGNQVSLDQTHRDNKPEKDSLSGPVSGDTMDLKLSRNGIDLPIILERK